ncbi:asparagine synthase-related protein [Streptomyces sp. NBC_00443]|uniref:asparagine synthase-related protein n=1 Tax=Streptomyces sp. NBC_00443 TaxID=2975743 RepID=UPI002E1DB780
MLPGHAMTVRAPGTGHRRYWSLPARPHTDSLETTVATVRRLLSEAVATHLRADVPVGAMLSGGIDSSALTALASRERRAAGAGSGRSR